MVKLLLALFLAIPATAQQGSVVLDHFGGLDDTNSAATIENYRAQDALNVESNTDGTALLKRQGYSREASLTVATSAVTGSFNFTNTAGDSVVVVCHDRYCAKSTNGSAFSVFLSSAGGASGAPTRWTFASVQGYLYGANDRRDPIFKYDGTTLTYPIGPPQGSIIELTEDRLVVGDYSSNPVQVSYSQSGLYTNFTTGINSPDPWTDEVACYGDRITGMRYNNGRLYIFKKNCISSCLLGDQYSTVCSILSNNIGTNDPNSVVAAPQGVFFRGNDNNYWRISENGLEILSQRISNLVKNQLTGSQRSNTQTSQSEWESGVQYPTGTFNTVSVAGSIFDSSTSLLDTSAADFSSGTLTNLSAGDTAGSLLLSSFTFQDNFADGNFTSGPVWSDPSGSWVVTSGVLINSFGSGAIYTPMGISTGSWQFDAVSAPNSGNTINIKFLSYGNALSDPGYALAIEHGVTRQEIRLEEYPGPTTLATFASYEPINGNDVLNTFRVVRNASGNFQVYSSTNGLILSATDTSVSSSTYLVVDCEGGNCKADNFYFYGYKPSGDIVSRTFDTTFTTAIGGPFQVNMSSYSDAAVTFQVQESADSSSFGSLASVTPGARVNLTRRFWRYKASYTSPGGTKTASIQDVTLQAATTGMYRTSCIQPNSQISSWGILSCTETNLGAGSLVYYATSAVSCATLPSSAPNAWQTTLTNNATITIATNTAVYLGFRSLLGSATDQARVDACTLYWNEGEQAQSVWGVYDSLKNSIYWTATTTSSTQGDRLIKLDLNLNEFYPFDIRATALTNVNNSIYFGSATGGYWNKYAPGGVYTDNGTSINARWKSKDFGGANPFNETVFNRLSIIARNQITGSMIATANWSSGQSSSHTVSLSTSSSLPYIRDNYNLPLTSPHNFMNVLLGNNSSTPFEVLGVKIDYTQKDWRPMNP